MIRPRALAGVRVLLVEDESLIAVMLEAMLVEQGCDVLGPIETLAEALVAAADERIDLALLDVNLGGETCYGLAELLEARRVPFVLLSGYGAEAIPPEHPGWRVFAKPFRAGDLVEYVAELLGKS